MFDGSHIQTFDFVFLLANHLHVTGCVCVSAISVFCFYGISNTMWMNFFSREAVLICVSTFHMVAYLITIWFRVIEFNANMNNFCPINSFSLFSSSIMLFGAKNKIPQKTHRRTICICILDTYLIKTIRAARGNIRFCSFESGSQ